VGALMALAEMARMEGKTAEATGLLERAVADNPDAIGPAMQLAKHYLRTGEKQKPLNLVRKLMSANPSNPDLIDLLGQTQLANNDQAGALETYSKLAAMLPKSANAHLRLATVHSAMKNDKAALDDARRAVDAEPDNVQAQLIMVTLMVRAGDTAKALPIIRAIEQKQPKSPLGFVLEGDLLSLQKNYDAAARAYGEAAALNANPQLVVKQVKALQLAGKGKAAEQRLAAYKKEHPDQSVVVLFEAQELLAEKQYKPAIAMFETLLKKEPENVAAINNLAWAYQQEKDSRALATAERAARLAPTSPSVNDTLGWILLEQGNVERALPLLQQAVQAAPNNGEIRYHLAAALLKKGDKAAAKKEIEVALAGKPFDQLEAARALRKQL
jgi:putative PEP-CTERM system TPR-repeat lipoprotein